MFSRIPLIMASVIMKHIFNDKRLEEVLKSLFHEKNAYFSKSSGIKLLKMLSLYILRGSKLPVQNYVEILNEVSEKAGEVGMTTAELLRKEGEKKGIEKGIEKGKIDAIEKMLAKGCDWAFITGITGFTRREYEKRKKSK
jgi:predicted transposase/invertase (TIGR01784 family)